jgi:hypothetical protein
MKQITRNLYTAAGSMDANKVRLIMMAITLAMFVLAAGAPEAGGEFMRR